MKELANKFSKIKILVFDFDGVMTDGYVYVDQDGRESVRCSRRDGLGISILKKAGLKLFVISTEKNPVVLARCKKLEIKCFNGVGDGNNKLEILKKIATEEKTDLSEIAYVGDDLNDYEVLTSVGLPMTVADGHPKLKDKCFYITEAPGGHHAVREICEKIIEARDLSLKYES